MVTVQCRLHSGPALAGRLCGAMVMNIGGWRCRVLERYAARRGYGVKSEAKLCANSPGTREYHVKQLKI